MFYYSSGSLLVTTIYKWS